MDNKIREEFNTAYPLASWEENTEVVRAIQFTNLRREWNGFQKGYLARQKAFLYELLNNPIVDDDFRKQMINELEWHNGENKSRRL